MSTRVLLEVIVSSWDDACAAAAGGADRFELCGALALGGLTPSLGTLDAIKAETDISVMFMLRPREGGMAYSQREFGVMLRDAELALESGADGLVFGFLTDEGEVDEGRCRTLLNLARQAPKPVQTVFHRAYDVVRNPRRALEQLIELNVTRVLTSGRAPTAPDGLDELRRTVEQAAGRIEVLPGGGIRLENLEELVRRTGVEQVHLSLMAPVQDPSTAANPAIHFGAPTAAGDGEYRALDASAVRRVRVLLDGLAQTAV
jgi:copper homeostasis protein